MDDSQTMVATLECTWGSQTSETKVLPKKTKDGLLLNILPFGNCKCLAYSKTAEETSKALGVLTPMPCIPNVVNSWCSDDKLVLVGDPSELNISSFCICTWGGIIKINFIGPKNKAQHRV